jgi:hypothetical protein
MSLANLFMELKIQAARNQTDRALDLKGGARLAVRVVDGVTTLTISRKGKRLGDTELVTFKRDCAIPPDAARYPAEGQGLKGDSWYVAFRWSDE